MAGFYPDDDEESPLVAFGGTLSVIGGSIDSVPPKALSVGAEAKEIPADQNLPTAIG